MDCRECSLCLDALVHDELSESDRKKVLSHLSGCESCKKEYEEELELKRRFDSFVEKSGKSLADSVVAEIRKDGKPFKKTPFLVRHMGIAASLVFILILAIYTGVSEVGKKNSDMYISEEGASATDADTGLIADIKNSANLKCDSEYEYAFEESFLESVTSKQESVKYEADDDYFFSDAVNGIPLETEKAIEPEEAPMPEPEAVTETLRAPDALKGESGAEKATVKIVVENLDAILPLLSDFEMIEIGENYIIVNATDYEAVLKIIEEKE